MPGLSEAHVVLQVKSYLEAHGWRALRMTSALVSGPATTFRTGEPGMPDYLFVFYIASEVGASALNLWVELKSPTDKRACRCLANQGTRKRCTVCDQKNWKIREARAGALVWTVSNFEAFERAYVERFGWLHSGVRARGQTELMLS